MPEAAAHRCGQTAGGIIEMKREWLWIIVLSVCIVAILPWTALRWHKKPAGDYQIRALMPDGKVDKLPLEEYLIGVVAAEMPAEFKAEALKAQAVAARTYAAKRLSHVAVPDPGYDVDTTVLTQAWLSDKQMRTKWGLVGYWRYRARIAKAVEGTGGQVLVANGEYIDAFFYSSSGRKPTEKSEEVWSEARPYLQNVSSGEKNPERCVKKFTFSVQELAQKLNLSQVPTNISSADVKVVSRTTAGRVRTLTLFGRPFAATQLRTLLGLASTDIEWSIAPGQITFTTYGNGHAVGMSQYGANDLAQKGQGYEEILAHFYPGTKILTLAKQDR